MGIIGDYFFNSLLDWVKASVIALGNSAFSLFNGYQESIFTSGNTYIDSYINICVYVGWGLYIVGATLTIFEFIFLYNQGQGDIQTTVLNLLKGFLAAMLSIPGAIQLFILASQLATNFGDAVYKDNVIIGVKNLFQGFASSTQVGGVELDILTLVILLVALLFSVFKIIFSTIKRGGILLGMFAIGSLYMISIPRGFFDGYTSWAKQVIGICIQVFVMHALLILGLETISSNFIIGCGLIMAATEIPQISQAFGVQIGSRGSLGSIAMTATNLLRVVH